MTTIASNIKERPILFSAPMVRAILDGRKTQTRRVIKGKGTWSVEDADDFSNRKWPGYEDEYGTWTDMPCPYGQPGDRLWVRETWACNPYDQTTWYRANDDLPPRREYGPIGWKPSIHMPRWASRITLEVVRVRVERLQDISEQDAIAEGVKVFQDAIIEPYSNPPKRMELTAVHYFADLWNKINGHGSWDANPWVWVVDFKTLTTGREAHPTFTCNHGEHDK